MSGENLSIILSAYGNYDKAVIRPAISAKMCLRLDGWVEIYTSVHSKDCEGEERHIPPDF
jgi:hypothetical protein